MTHRLILETRGEVSVIQCNHCRLPAMEIKSGELSVESKHGSSKHKSILTIEHLRMIAIEMYRQTHPPERW